MHWVVSAPGTCAETHLQVFLNDLVLGLLRPPLQHALEGGQLVPQAVDGLFFRSHHAPQLLELLLLLGRIVAVQFSCTGEACAQR